MGWVIFLGILLLLAILPVGISLIYNEDGLTLSLLMGLVKVKLYPRKKKEKAEKKPAPAKKSEKKKTPQKEEKTKKGGKLTDFLPLVQLALDFLGALRRKLRVRRLELLLVMAGGDPCDLALNYGKAWTAAGNLIPLLEQIFVIKKRDIQVQCDFVGDTTRVKARLDITITVGRVISLLVKYGVLALRKYFKIKKSKEGGASK